MRRKEGIGRAGLQPRRHVDRENGALAPEASRGLRGAQIFRQKEIVTDKPIRVAVVGVGDFGRNHVRVWSEMEGVELVGVVDTNAERAAAVAAEFKTHVIRDFESLSARKN